MVHEKRDFVNSPKMARSGLCLSLENKTGVRTIEKYRSKDQHSSRKQYQASSQIWHSACHAE